MDCLPLLNNPRAIMLATQFGDRHIRVDYAE
jgi:hypothetical protein